LTLSGSTTELTTFSLRPGRVARAVALAAALSMLSTCAHAVPGARPGASHGPTRVGIAQSSVLGGEVVDSYFPATGAQFTTGAQFVGTVKAVASTIMSACMMRSGFHLAGESAANASSLFFDNSQFPDLAKISRTGILNPSLLTPQQGPPTGMPAAEQQAYQSDEKRCGLAAATPFAPLSRASLSLSASWLGITGRIESSGPVVATLAGYRSCLERAGAPAARVTSSSSAGSFDVFLAWVSGQESQAHGLTGAIAVDRHWAPIFVRCAKMTVAVQEPLQLARQKTFLQEHHQQVQGLQTLAIQEVAAAKRRSGSTGTG
jgi:hypothetical protein